MSSNSWNQTLISASIAGTTLTAASAASCIPPAAVFTLPANTLKVGDKISILASGIISCAVTTPGTARFDFRVGSAVVWDSGALNLNIVAKSNVPWFLKVELTVRSIGNGTVATILGQGTWESEAVIGSPLPTVGGCGTQNVPVGSVAVGTGFNSTVSNTLDLFFTQTVATGSMTLQQYEVTYKT
jgi:hypothetical protein